MLGDWESMCHQAFRGRWFGTEEERKLLDISHLPQVRWGVYFETLVIGSGMGGATIELTDKELKSVFYGRVVRQAKVARDWLMKKFGGEIVGRQVTVYGSITIDGVTIPLEGNIDVEYLLNLITIIIDLKLTGDLDNTYGKYCWGEPDKIDTGQLVMYGELIYQRDGVYPPTHYYVADNSGDEKSEILNIINSDEYKHQYWQRVKNAFIGISRSLKFGWDNKASYNTCVSCPIKHLCPAAIKTPEMKTVYK